MRSNKLNRLFLLGFGAPARTVKGDDQEYLWDGFHVVFRSNAEHVAPFSTPATVYESLDFHETPHGLRFSGSPHCPWRCHGFKI